LKVRILPFLKNFTQLTARLKNFLRGWLLILELKEGLVECATVCVKSEVILIYIIHYNTGPEEQEEAMANLSLPPTPTPNPSDFLRFK
jgi:hypothetical protein